MANTRILSKLIEPYIRESLRQETGCEFYNRDVKLNLVTGGSHKFDIVSLDKDIVGDIKSNQIRENGSVGVGVKKSIYFDIYMLSLVEAKRKLLVLTSKDFYNLFKRISVGKVPDDIEIILVELPDDIKVKVKKIHGLSSSEIGKKNSGMLNVDSNNFQYKSDYMYFIQALAGGNEELFAQKFFKMFDFRSPTLKRKEFNLIRNKAYKELVIKYGEKCQLNLCPDCSEVKLFDVDHYIPLSTNELNKKLRKMNPSLGKKVVSQSFGSNDISNLQIACKRCNAYKKHKIIL